MKTNFYLPNRKIFTRGTNEIYKKIKQGLWKGLKGIGGIDLIWEQFFKGHIQGQDLCQKLNRKKVTKI